MADVRGEAPREPEGLGAGAPRIQIIFLIKMGANIVLCSDFHVFFFANVLDNSSEILLNFSST